MIHFVGQSIGCSLEVSMMLNAPNNFVVCLDAVAEWETISIELGGFILPLSWVGRPLAE